MLTECGNKSGLMDASACESPAMTVVVPFLKTNMPFSNNLLEHFNIKRDAGSKTATTIIIRTTNLNNNFDNNVSSQPIKTGSI